LLAEGNNNLEDLEQEVLEVVVAKLREVSSVIGEKRTAVELEDGSDMYWSQNTMSQPT
jgi:hypothetical protein